MIDQLVIGNKSSFDDFSATVKERNIEAPKKKSIKDTVPFSNITYDFSNINGEIYWEERKLEYVLEVIEATPEKLEEKKILLKTWLMNVFNEKLYDPFIDDYHFIATFEDIKFDDSEIEKSIITVTFAAYPYMVSNEQWKYSYNVADSMVITITNNSSHKIAPTIESDANFTLTMNDISYSIGEGTYNGIKLDIGDNNIEIIGSGTISFSFNEEVF